MINLNDLAANFVQIDHLAMGVDANGNGIADICECTFDRVCVSTPDPSGVTANIFGSGTPSISVITYSGSLYAAGMNSTAKFTWEAQNT